ncbi:MAG: tyrosine--tRNA ligase, partial [Bacilli bacterium]|nr:tyrosine--tRNA ligase [Bacilli bacterium]
DIINRRLETCITYAEFSYMLIQGYDFLNMYEKMGCTMQVEGSDQWGNITTGIDLIRKIKGEEAYAFTMPLILDATGKKFGKSEGNALWLDKNKTSSYELYQYLINTDDSMVYQYLKVFTFLTPEEIDNIMEEHNKEPHLRIAQKKLAECIITDLHGEEEFNKAEQISQALFSGDLTGLSADEICVGMKMVPSIKLSGEIKLIDLLVDNGICSSRREAREMLSANAISINNEKYTDENAMIDASIAIDGKVIVIRKGKKKQFLGIFE